MTVDVDPDRAARAAKPLGPGGGEGMTELTVHTESTELPSGQVLRVSRVENPRDTGETVVLEKLVGSQAARSLMEPASGARLVLRASELPELVEMLESLNPEGRG